MITKAFAVYDSKAKFFGVPFFMQQTGLAVRAFTDLAVSYTHLTLPTSDLV